MTPDGWPGVAELLAVTRPRQAGEGTGRLVLTCHHSVRSELALVGLNEAPSPGPGAGRDYRLVQFDVQVRIAAGYWRLTEDGEVVGDGFVSLREVAGWQIHDRDGGKCVVTGEKATEVHHRIHGNRDDRRPSNLLSVSRPGHVYIENNFTEAERRGWTVSRHTRLPTSEIRVWYAAGPLGQGDMILDDLLGINIWQPPEKEETDE